MIVKMPSQNIAEIIVPQTNPLMISLADSSCGLILSFSLVSRMYSLGFCKINMKGPSIVNMNNII